MSIWTRISDALKALASGEGLSNLFDQLRTPPERSIGFTIAIIGLGAKMAKADGQVTREEVIVFRQIFQIPPEDEAHAAKVFDLARQDVAGYEAYAAKIAKMFKNDREMLIDLLEGLIHIAMADGEYHPKEDMFLTRVAEIFGLESRVFMCLRARHVPGMVPDPYSVLGIAPSASYDELKARYRVLVRSSHPDVMIARGLPEEAVQIATNRLATINAAWENVRAERQPELA
ncbi:MAG: molecular chaperone DjiA [Rhodobacteraceae bacterium]|nr:molecular chaperone DjiA [Paracoccaceae bacterium]